MEKQLEEVRRAIKLTEEQIKGKTKDLQKDLKELKNELNILEEKIKKNNREEMLDKNTHIVDRFFLWLDSKNKMRSDWRIKAGAVWDILYDDLEKYEPVRLYEVVSDYLRGMLGVDLKNKKEVKQLFNEASENTKEKITTVLEDAIEQNVGEFINDW